MNRGEGSNRESRVIIILFTFIVISFLLAAVTGTAWEILDITNFSFTLVILSIVLSVTAGAVLTYSFVAFFQSHEVRHLMLIVMSANILLWIILFLLSHPSSVEWSVQFSDRNRNRTLAMAFVLVVIPAVLLGSFSGEMKPSQPSVFLLMLWGEIVMPILSLFLFFSPNPLFIIVTSEGGIQGLTPIGAIISLGYLISQIIALPRLIQKWWKTRNSMDLSLMLALVLWIFGTSFIIILWDPLQVAELIWVISIIMGFILISMSLFMTSIINPHRYLERQVQQRTAELKQSMGESEFYLKMWTHKMGNLLQGMITYLDILEHAAQYSEEDRNVRGAARSLSREATLVNLQVSQLTRIKEHLNDALYPVNVAPFLETAVKSAEQFIGEDNFTVEFNVPEEYSVIADRFLPLVFQSLLSYNSKNRIDDKIKFTITTKSEDHQQIISIISRGEPISEVLQKYMESEEAIESIALNLNLFTAKMLLSRYQAKIQYDRNDVTSENTWLLIFPEKK